MLVGWRDGSISQDPGTCHVVYSAVYSPTLTAVFVSSSDALLPPPILLCTLMRLLLLGAGRTMALNGRAGSATGDDGGELAMSAAVTSGRGPSRLPLIRGDCRESVRSIDLSRRGGTGWLCLCVSPFRLFPPAVGAGLCWLCWLRCTGAQAESSNRRDGRDEPLACLPVWNTKKERKRRQKSTMSLLRRRQPSETTPQKKGFMFRRTGASYGRSPEIEGSPVSKLRVFFGGRCCLVWGPFGGVPPWFI